MRSDNVKTGMQQAPHRSLFNALGLTKEDWRDRLSESYVLITKSFRDI